MVNEISKEQIFDTDIVEEDELSSAGVASTAFLTGLTITNINSGTKQVTFSANDLIEKRVSKYDILVISTGAAAGTYTIDTVVDELNLRVNEAIVSTTSGAAAIYYRSGAQIIGFDPTSTLHASTTVKGALRELYDKAVKPRVVKVSSNPVLGEYSSIAAALASITDAATNNRYIIEVYPGVYAENNPVVMKSYVHIVGMGGPRLTRVEAANANQDLFTGAHNTFMSGLYLTGVSGSGKCLINLGASAIANSIFNMMNCRFGVTDTILKSTAGSLDNHVYIYECLWSHGDAFDKGFLATTSGAGGSKIHLVGCIAEKFGVAPSYVGYATGANCEIEVVSCDMDTDTTPGTSIGFKADTGGRIHLTGTTLSGFGKAIQTINTGATPHVHCSAVKIEDCTVDIEINHTTTHGNFTGVAARSKITNAAPTSFMIAYMDPDNANFNNSGMLITRGLSPELTTTVTSNSTLQLTRFDTHTQIFTGSTAGQILELPNATTFTKTGHIYDVWNFSSVNVTIKDFGNNTLAVIKPNGHTVIVLRDISTSSGLWGLTYTVDSGNVFGTEIYSVIDESETSNNSGTTWVNKLTLNTPSTLPLGDYMVQFQFIWRSSSANREADFRFRLNGSNIVAWQPSTGRTQDRQLLSGFKRIDDISGVNSITFDFKYANSSTTIYVQQARMFIWRIN